MSVMPWLLGPFSREPSDIVLEVTLHVSSTNTNERDDQHYQ